MSNNKILAVLLAAILVISVSTALATADGGRDAACASGSACPCGAVCDCGCDCGEACACGDACDCGCGCGAGASCCTVS